MLATLSVHNFALVDQMTLEFGAGMTVISGETGAGKSILLDALGVALGQRADANWVRRGSNKAEVSAAFDNNPIAIAWLEANELPVDDEIILRRSITAEGRSRGFINGRSASASDLRDLAKCLIDVHSQHAHQRLLEKDSARGIVDAYAQLTTEANQLADHWRTWKRSAKQLTTLRNSSGELLAQRQLLAYQVEELRDLAPQEHELEDLEAEHKRLSNAEHTILSGQSAIAASSGDDSGNGDSDAASQLIYQSLQRLDDIDDKHPLLEEARDLLTQARIQVDEAMQSLEQYLSNIDINPHRLQQLESRLSSYYTMARKHQIHPEALYDYWQNQEQALASLSLSDEDLEALEREVSAHETTYREGARSLGEKRRKAAVKLDKAIMGHFESLALNNARFTTRFTELDTKQANANGSDDIWFEVQTNPGMPAGPLGKVVSGGELARISLAIQVVTAATTETPCLIFDEVDVGIGGGTAERVGRLMRQLGKQSQIMCVTHQPQVAAQAHQHFQVSKVSGDKATHTRIRELKGNQRSEEVARMLGGVEITSQTLAHASEMLALATSS
ncbi:MAG: DNA repair protein RecN [Oleibacter sp.]|nr:DNA repair protein RecN [Thalassolituus sp.]